MFKFLKDKLKKAANFFSKEVKKNVEVVEEKPKKKEAKKEVKPKVVPKQKPKTVSKPKPQAKPKFELKSKLEKKKVEVKPNSGIFEKPVQKSEPEEQKIQEPEEIQEPQLEEEKEEIIEEPVIEEKEPEPEVQEEKKVRKGVFSFIKEKITKTTLTEEKFDSLFWDLELALLENNVAVEVIEKIKADLAKNLVNVPISRKGIDKTISDSLRNSISELFDVEQVDLIDSIKKKKPFVIIFVGVNGAGKTTTIAKVAKILQNQGISCVIGAGDTFRSAAIEQLETHANNLDIKCIKHDYGSDSAAVAFDAIKHAESKGKDAVLIDTAGRTHVDKNLMEELKKVIRVSKPDMTIFVGDALTGNDAVEQAKEFNETVGIDGIILAKADVDEKGGSAISISYVTKKPILYLGTGQNYEDLTKFTPDFVMENLQLDEPDEDSMAEEE